MPTESPLLHPVAVVVPVYQGEATLQTLLEEIETLASPVTTAAGHQWKVAEILLVHDGAIDRSHEVMERLASGHPLVRTIWLSRNFGQHAATLAGMASTISPWVVTIDEDGQQDPRSAGRLLDAALASHAQLVYAQPTNEPPHGLFRNLSSRTVKWIFTHLLAGSGIGEFNSFRLIEGEIARSIAAYSASRVYLDVALSWVVAKAVHCPVELRPERGRRSGYRLRSLISHFWQLVLTSGTGPLRLVAIAGALAIVAAGLLAVYVVWRKLTAQVPVQGWASTILVIAFFDGAVLLALGVIAEYLGIVVSMAMGKPPYLIVSHPVPGPPRDTAGR